MQTAETIVSMENGCVCCTVRTDLVQALVELAGMGPFDAILLGDLQQLF